MKNIALKIISVLVIVLLVFSFTMGVNAKDAIGMFKPNIDTEAAQKVGDVGGQIIGVLQVFGTVVAIVILVYLGIKYVMAAPEEKADIKKTAWIYFVGAIVIFAAPNIVKIIYNYANKSI